MHNVLPDNFCGGLVNWRVRLVHWAAKAAGLLVHIEGFPVGTARNIDFSQNEAAAGAP